MKNRKLRVMISALSAISYGGESYFRSLIPALRQYGPDLECLLLVRDNRFDGLCREAGNITPIPCALPKGFQLKTRIVWEQFALPRIIVEHNADVFYSANNLTLLNSSRPCVIAVRNMEALVPINPAVSLPNKIRNQLLSWLSRISLNKAARVIVVSEFVRKTILALGIPATKLDLIYHGIDDIPEDKPVSHPSGNVFSVAKFIRYANLETLFRGFSHMRSLGYRGKLIFAGGEYDRAYEIEMKNFIEQLNIKDHVSFVGYISRDEVGKYMHESDAFLFSSTLEACPFSLLEGLRHGAAIVSTNSQPMPEFCGDGAIFVGKNDFEGLGNSAYKVVTDSSLNQALRQKALARSRNFTWSENVRQLATCWERAACVSP